MKIPKNVLRSICIVIVAFAFYMLMVFTPLFSDDWNYYLIFGTDQRIESLSDVFVSQYNHYLTNNGRFVPHFFVQLFDGILGKDLFNIVNTLVFLSFLILLIRINNRTEWVLLPIALALILLLMPGFNNAFLWMSGACNYLWAAVLLLLYYRLLTRDEIDSRYYPLLFLFAIVCGWTNEALIVGFLAGCLCYFLFNKKDLTSHRTVLLVGMTIGALFLVLAPGSIHRFMSSKEGVVSLSGVVRQLLSSLLAMGNLRMLPLFFLMLLALSLFKKIPENFFPDNTLWIVAVAISFVFVLITGHQAAHSRFGIEFFSLVLILRLLDHFTIPRGLIVASGFAVLLLLAQTLYYSYVNHSEYKRCVAQIQSSETGIIETNEVDLPPFFERLIVRFKPSETDDYYYFHSAWIDRYFGKENLLFLPQRFLDRIRNEIGAFEEFETITDLPFYVKHINAESIDSAVFELSELRIRDIPLLLRPFADKMERYSAKEVRTSKVSIINLPQGRYVLVMKNHVIADRVESIVVQ